MTFQNLEYFLEIAQDLNLNKTAERLYTTQQNLSSHIRRLEAYYGIELFYRKPTFSLTEEGYKLVQTATDILKLNEKLCTEFAQAREHDRNTLTVICSTRRLGDACEKILYQMYRRYPGICIMFGDQNLDNGLSAIFSSGDVDFAIGGMGLAPKGIQAISLRASSGQLACTHSLLEHVFGKNTENFIRKCKGGLEYRDLPEQIPLLVRVTNQRPGKLMQKLTPEYIERKNNIFLDASTHDMDMHLCCAGQGALVVSGIRSEYLLQFSAKSANQEMVLLPLIKDGKPITMDYYLYYSTQMDLTPQKREFIKVVKDVMGKSG